LLGNVSNQVIKCSTTDDFKSLIQNGYRSTASPVTTPRRPTTRSCLDGFSVRCRLKEIDRNIIGNLQPSQKRFAGRPGGSVVCGQQWKGEENDSFFSTIFSSR
jgi:hypothetical protein